MCFDPGDVGLQVLHVNLAVVVVRLVLVDVVSIGSCKLLQNLPLLIPCLLMSGVPLFYALSDLLLHLLFHGLRHVRLSFHQHRHPVVVVLLLVQLELVKSTLLLLLAIVVLGRLLLLDLPLCLLQTLVQVLQHVLLLFSCFLLLFLRVHFEQFVRDVQQSSQVGILCLKLYYSRLLLCQVGRVDVTVILNKSYFELVALVLIELEIGLYFTVKLPEIGNFVFGFAQFNNLQVFLVDLVSLTLDFPHKTLDDPLVSDLLEHDGINLSSVLEFDIANQFLELVFVYFDVCKITLLADRRALRPQVVKHGGSILNLANYNSLVQIDGVSVLPAKSILSTVFGGQVEV